MVLTIRYVPVLGLYTNISQIFLSSSLPLAFITPQKYLAVGSSTPVKECSARLRFSLIDFLRRVSPVLGGVSSSPREIVLTFSGIVTLVISLTIISATCHAISSFSFSCSSLVTSFFTALLSLDAFLVPSALLISGARSHP